MGKIGIKSPCVPLYQSSRGTFFVKVSKVVKYEANFAKGVLVTAEKLNTTVTDTQRPQIL